MITRDEAIEVLKTVVDPEIGIDIWTLELVYKVEMEKEVVKILMTFTSPFCPYGPALMEDIKRGLEEKGVKDIEIEITFDPPWKPSDALRDMLGM